MSAADGTTTQAFKSAVLAATGASIDQGPTVTSLKVYAGTQTRGRAFKLLRKLD